MSADSEPLMTPRLLKERLVTAEAALLTAERVVAADRAKRVKAHTALCWVKYLHSRHPDDPQALRHLRAAERRYRRVCIVSPIPTAEPAQRAYDEAVAQLAADGGAA